MQTFRRTRPYASAAPYTLRGAGNFPRGKPHRAGLFAGGAGDAALLFPVYLHKAETVEPAVDGSQGTKILAKRAVNLDGEKQDHEQYPQLPRKQGPKLPADLPVGGKEGDCAEQGSGGTQILAERRNLGETPEQEQGAQSHQTYQDQIFAVFQDMVQGQPLPFAENGNFMQKILYQAEGAQPAADKTPQQAPKQEENAQHGKGDMETPLVQQRLERAYGAGGHRAGTGIAVQPRNTGVLQAAPVYFPLQEAISISVREDGKQKLYRQAQFFHHVTRFRYIHSKSSPPCAR